MEITNEKIDRAIKAGACAEAIAWLMDKIRTLEDLKKYDPAWYVWGMINIPDCPINLAGLTSYDRARVMALRPDCPLDLTGLTSYDRARVMIERSDCPIDLAGLTASDRARVMAHRPDCPLDLTGLTSYDRAWVISIRSDWSQML